MKHDQLRAVAHNVTASIGEGCSFLVGVYDTGVEDALKTVPGGVITADFLHGTIDPPLPGSQLAIAVSLMPEALPRLCAKHGVPVCAFRELRARYSIDLNGLRCTVIIEDEQGRRSETDYGGYDTQRVKRLDHAGRLRKRSVRRSAQS
jgi:hypothetical protein